MILKKGTLVYETSEGKKRVLQLKEDYHINDCLNFSIGYHQLALVDIDYNSVRWTHFTENQTHGYSLNQCRNVPQDEI